MEKLGPCPLCGGEAIHEEINTMAPEIAQCEHDGCEMANWMAVETWQKLSALAASEKRLKAEVERLTEELRRIECAKEYDAARRLIQDYDKIRCERDVLLRKHDAAAEHITKLTAREKRMREALERCREMFRQCSRASEGDDQEAFEIMERECEEALK